MPIGIVVKHIAPEEARLPQVGQEVFSSLLPRGCGLVVGVEISYDYEADLRGEDVPVSALIWIAG
jgi:hypothetical protein